MSRSNFLAKMLQLASPVLTAASTGELRKKMVVEQKPDANREKYAGLEAVARLLNGMSPWFEAELTDTTELQLQSGLIRKAQAAIAGQVDPASDDFTDHRTHGTPFSQILVDAALLAQAILRAPIALWDGLPASTKTYTIELMESARKITPIPSNWVLFSTEIELFYHKATGRCNSTVLHKYFDLVNSWYFGDGWYGDGPHFKTDFYNSLIIHPMMLDMCDFAPDILPPGSLETILSRAQRHAEVLENLVAPDGTYIATGRSLTYRCGVFHLLAQLTLQNRLPASISPATAREILYAVTEKTLTTSSYRNDGFLNIGICRPQPQYGETYICTGSLYMASAAFLPLGISANNNFWSQPAESWTQRKIWHDERI